MGSQISKNPHVEKIQKSNELTRVYFEDHGQDFLLWDIDEGGNVVNCEPFQSSIWIGCKLSGGQNLIPGHHIEFWTKDFTNHLRLNYPIEKVERKEATNG